ncbi:MAG TPA: hypothetical protein VGE41_02755 [Verrucomicrobiae bacterium]|jgi:hypothetical protein
MWMRLVFVIVLSFFVVMNILLVRSEFGGKNQVSSAVPIDLIFQKILTAPDDSFLEIRQHGKKIGTCHWAATVGEKLSQTKLSSEDLAPEGMVEEASGYSLEIKSGSVSTDDLKLRFNLELKVSTNQTWQEFTMHVTMRPTALELRSSAAEQTVRVRLDDGTGKSERTFRFEELQHPDKILHEFGGPGLPMMLGAMGIPLKNATNSAPQNFGLKWESREDKLKVGDSFMRVYRLHALALGHFPVNIYVSRIGEILRLELPNDIVLVNDALGNF